MSGDVLENLSRRMVSLVRFFGSKEMNKEGRRKESGIDVLAKRRKEDGKQARKSLLPIIVSAAPMPPL